MESIEQSLHKINQCSQDAIKKQQLMFTNSIHNSAKVSNTCSNNLDREFRKLFPEVETLGTETEEPFNPSTVVEFRDNKAYQVIDSWDKDDGLLPNRKVMYDYHIDINTTAKNMKWYCSTHKIWSGITCSGCNQLKAVDLNCNHSPSYYKMTCGCNLRNHYLCRYNPDYASLDLIRKINDSLFKTYTFEVDNYLNLFHVESGLYIMFNKTSFPIIPFVLNNGVYYSKQMETIFANIFNKTYQQSKDSQVEFIEKVNEVVPDDIEQVYDLFNRFRQFKSFNYGGSIVPKNVPEIEDDKLDSRDKLIKSYQLRLNEMTKQFDSAQKLINDMTEEYENKSNKVKEVTFELNQCKSELLEKTNQFKKELLEKELGYKMESVKEIEELKSKNFGLNQQFLEIETYKAKLESSGVSMDSIKRENSELELKIQKIRNINDKLLKQLRKEKGRNEDLNKYNNTLNHNIIGYEESNTKLKRQIDDLKDEVKDRTSECGKLSKDMIELGNRSSDVLENALSDKLEQLELKYQDQKDANMEIERENKRMEKELKKYKDTLSKLLG